ncbi:MAG: hypothetical protein VX615_01165 [Planctomycetota bacterium]|nr:hypothetical protein [Planctomycetota bacterium]
MPIKTKLATRYWLKTVLMMIVCVVLGLWGIWDYLVAIPEAARGAARAEILRVIKIGLDTPNGSTQRLDAITLIDVALQSEGYTDRDWDAGLAQMKVALEGASIEIQRKAMGGVEEGLNAYGNITAPSKYDRPMQWVFMSCLPFGLWYLLSYMKMKKRASMYELDDDGTLTTPEGSWPASDVKDIDMSKWISKTAKARLTWTAKVVVEGREPIELDDYVYQDMHLIIGALAHQFYPDDWTPLARRVKFEYGEEGEEE